ncbi:MAG: hypothetical protein A3J07_04665 [Candidatus Doudnabacteria bacterium RIFCSPLOWO2_02_FULL_49_13]|uniref:Glutamyl-tRNA amidotransferase n=1 Tax=Candidatus Doudnabacteria bacterium RIFCSPHIGHO2_12_FULL_48_16 TaxID=1817838 RepID=A0A1F5PJT0_9BACT|nr:MAG: hypothetical protein A3B77_04760 [Candidatus Doudnabacteria bacterium RIFCSPHIGHO2_02_FULL_49_24]OGE89936.1 MAG: hypothetical protein A2760_00515 [Candidatus Doudnabacteria bacterium RIFCSPHIGHO2_01_FULL_50_67]OGE90198.1 MAG: hypothetical protein A3E29_03800 [Candidatus Doudnabacteria bacterium RIFCSPHIGHO2_12_FULL_48_16]OGE97739.1 MAG: hypothetical protein A2990_00845 [Candidatus Doudnabacteria bacterium RIFCSPLOWO2_01_FULL_49_40]OGF02880.1 MAG: hypothetical protein A3H14_00275 [Candid
MSLIQTIDQDLTTALKAKDEIAVSALRNLKAAFKNAEIAAQTQSGRASPTEGGRELLSDGEALKVVAKKVKQHKDSIESFAAGGRADLVANEQAQMKTLEKYLPQALPESEVAKIVDETIATGNATKADFGRVMKEVVAKVGARADGSVISKLVKERLK